MADLGYRLKEVRSKHGLSREELAKEVKTSAETLRKIEERLTKSPRAHLIFNLARTLNVTPEYLLFGNNKDLATTSPSINQSHHSTIQIKLPEPFVIDDNIRQELERRVIFELRLIRERQALAAEG